MQTDELYVAMFALVPDADGTEAAKLPMEFRDVACTESGMYLASLALMNPKLEPTVERVGEFYDGYWTDVRQQNFSITRIGTDSRYTPLHSYVRSYDPHLDADLLTVETGELIPA